MNICYLSAINPHIFKYLFFIFFFCFKFYSADHYFLFQITQAYLRTEFMHIQLPHRRCDLHKFFLIYNPIIRTNSTFSPQNTLAGSPLHAPDAAPSPGAPAPRLRFNRCQKAFVFIFPDFVRADCCLVEARISVLVGQNEL